MIELRGLTKVYGPTKAVDDLSFTVKPGIVTGFLGPNGAGKSTTMRMILGLDQPTSGAALIEGKPYRELKTPLRTVGALLDAKWVHPNRSARAHLQWMAASNGIPKSRVDEVLGLVGLSEVAGKKAGGFSLGMSQRLGLAGALLGDPKVLLFDEPVNGLDGTKLSAAQAVPADKRSPEQKTVADASIAGDRHTLKADSFIPVTMAVIYLLLLLYFKGIGGYFQRFCKPNNSINIFSACPHIPFLATSMNEGVHLVVGIDVQKPNPLRAMEFMAGPGDKINIDVR